MSHPTPFARLALAAVRAYQLAVRPMLSGQCRYLPTCSEYAAEAIATHGALRGGWIGITRVMRCHPFGGSGVDPVPAARLGELTASRIGKQSK